MCNPRNEQGYNTKPKDSEIKRYSVYLKEVIELINPKIVVTLGEKALKGLDYISEHSISLKENVETPVYWNGYTVFPLYYCSPKAFIHRSEQFQLQDYRFLSEYAKKII